MKIYTCKEFTGHWPVVVAAVVRANNAQEAVEKLNTVLRNQDLRGDAKVDAMIELPDNITVRILNDGNY